MKRFAVMILLVAALLALASGQGNNNDRCNYLCAANYDPLCATSGNQRRTFNNRCLMERENCRTNSNFQSLRRGVC